MSTSSLPSSLAPFFTRTLSHSAEPQQSEHRISLVNRLWLRSTKNSVKKSRNSDAQLRLIAQDNVTLPTYGAQGRIEGVVELFKPDNIISVDVKVSSHIAEHRQLGDPSADRGQALVKGDRRRWYNIR